MTDARLWFSPPVTVRTEHPGRSHGVNNVTAAAEQLLKWEKRGPKWRAAVQTCLDAQDGQKTAADVRKAFEAAAKEAGMLRQHS